MRTRLQGVLRDVWGSVGRNANDFYNILPTRVTIQNLAKNIIPKRQVLHDAHHGANGANGHGNGHGSKLHSVYYTGGVLALTATVAHEIFTGNAKETYEDQWYIHHPPSLSNVRFGAFTPHQKIPRTVLEELNKTYLSPTNRNNIKRLVICGEGGVGKLSVAMHIAEELDSRKSGEDHFYISRISLRGHTLRGLQEDIIRAALRLKLKDNKIIARIPENEEEFQAVLKEAKAFLSAEIRSRPGANIVIRCVRDEKVLDEIEEIINPPKILPSLPSWKVNLIVTTGNAKVAKGLSDKKYESISLDRSFTKEDLDDYFAAADLSKCQISKIGDAERMHLVDDIFERNPTLARISVAYFKKNPDMTIDDYLGRMEIYTIGSETSEPMDTKEAILRLSLDQLKKDYPLAQKILNSIAPTDKTLQSAGLFMKDLVKDKELLDAVPAAHKKNAEQYLRKSVDALVEYGLVNINTNKAKIYQTILVDGQASCLRKDALLESIAKASQKEVPSVVPIKREECGFLSSAMQLLTNPFQSIGIRS